MCICLFVLSRYTVIFQQSRDLAIEYKNLKSWDFGGVTEMPRSPSEVSLVRLFCNLRWFGWPTQGNAHDGS